ncbi:hypothetical protein [uncultured Amphritea sp.]|uniref:hypothetical protein n=1 Tax=uncultured Amphritea sp. TaxID=981605 RepID=UPI002602BC59|nr:hypothetical protein [uncultured Amphritea sp.]
MTDLDLQIKEVKQIIESKENDADAIALENMELYKSGWFKGSWRKDTDHQERYYENMRKLQAIRRDKEPLIQKVVILKKQQHVDSENANRAAIELREKTALKELTVTSATYERAQKRLFQEVNGFVSGNRY